jgi:hypothetical protein
MSEHPRRQSDPPPQRRSHAGLTFCLRCDQLFYSWDRRQNRLCDACREALKDQPSEEPTHPVPKGWRGRKATDEA